MADSSLSAGMQMLASHFRDFIHQELLPDLKAKTVPVLYQCLQYALDAGGKALRPVLCLQAAGFTQPNSNPAFRYACLQTAAALECIHTYSLIHDDLPAMDDDDLRRGRATLHRQFGEWQAILAGDALNTFAFELLADLRDKLDANQVVQLLTVLGRAAGVQGMVAGQALDLEHEKQIHPDKTDSKPDSRKVKDLQMIHDLKTAALLSASCEMGALLAGLGTEERQLFASYGRQLGLLFQITDDILDETGTAAEMGKTTGKDRDQGKWTYPLLLGLQSSQKMAADICQSLVTQGQSLDQIASDSTTFWQSLPVWIMNRNH